LTIFVHKFYCWSGWTRLYHNLRLGSNVCTLLYYCQSDKTGLIRSEVVQEVYGWLLGHWSVRSLMFQVAEHAQISPLRLSNT
ncbi:MAG: hypothetical protein KME05_20715, partial [Gloeocapsa sp. UFS-A4-WI-NPMV-4B04]|nr:hypothetical protein [Gloeocapsa sp. UFS-A4-WI-NPMV-4B04]